MPIKVKQWNDRREADDGYRLLVCRYRPRALPTAKETWNAWCPDLGPSRQLHAKLYGKSDASIPWAEFRTLYLAEMASQTELIDELAEMAAEGKTITLLCSAACSDASQCHRTLLRDLIEQRLVTATVS